MKQLLIFALIFILALGLCACSMGGTVETFPSTASTTQATATAPTAMPETSYATTPTETTKAPHPSAGTETSTTATGETNPTGSTSRSRNGGFGVR